MEFLILAYRSMEKVSDRCSAKINQNLQSSPSSNSVLAKDPLISEKVKDILKKYAFNLNSRYDEMSENKEEKKETRTRSEANQGKLHLVRHRRSSLWKEAEIAKQLRFSSQLI